MRPIHRDPLLIWILLGAAVVRVWGIHFGLPSALQARPDERPIICKAVGFASGDLNPHEFNYPSLYFYLLYGAYSVLAWVYVMGEAATHGQLLTSLYAQGATILHVVNRLIVAGFGVATVLVWWRVAAQTFGKGTGRLAALLLAFAYLHVRESHFGVTDVPMVFFIVAAHWPILGIVQHGRWRSYVAAGILTGLAVSTKYTAAPLCLSIGVAHVCHHRGVQWQRVVAAWAVAGIAFCCTTPYAVLDFGAFWRDVYHEVFVRGGEGHFVNPGIGWAQHLRVSLRYGLGLPFCLIAVLGLVLSMRQQRRRALVLLVFPFASFLAIAFRRTVFVRYALPLTPFLAIWAAWACSAVHRRAGRWWAIVVVWAALVPSLMRTIAFDTLVSRQDTRCLAAEWLETRLAPGEVVGWLGAQQTVPLLRTRPAVGREGPSLARVVFLAGPEEPRTEGLRYIVTTQHSALPHYCPVVPGMADLLKQRFEPVAKWEPQGAQRHRAIWDVQDAFFVPFARLRGATRPGPGITIFRRRHRESGDDAVPDYQRQ